MNETTEVAPIDLTPAKKLTAEIVSANFRLELSKLKYQEALAGLVAYKVTRENVQDAQNKLKEARKMLTRFEEIKKKGKEEALAICRWWDDAYNGTKESFESELNVKSRQVTKIANELAEEIREAETEKQRKAGILAEIDSFFITQSQAVAGAATSGELVRVQKLIGSHKAASRYGEYLPLVAQKASNLEELIKVQKESIKILTALKGKEMALESIGDDEAVLALREEQEVFTAKLEQQKIDVQETAISMAVTPTDGYVDVIAPAAPKPRRQTWAWEVNDDIISGEIMYRSGIKRVAKAMPSWVELKIISKRVDDYLDARKAGGIEGDEFEHNGVRFFIKKSY